MSSTLNSVLTPASSNDSASFRTLADWLAWQEKLHLTEIELGLERSMEVARKLDILSPAPTVITVAGTNGKGSSVAMLEAIYVQAGYTVGCYTSPHLQRYNERIRINQEALDDGRICQSFERINAARGDISLTYFEFDTLAALDIFSLHGVDIAILEVGLGGRLDAVNIIDANAALITAIGIDHTDWLGDNREDIGREKAGIFRPQQIAVCSDRQMPDSVARHARDLNTCLTVIGRDFDFSTSHSHWSWRNEDQCLADLPAPGLTGEFQLDNAAGVLEVVQRLQQRCPVDRDALAYGIANARVSGRFQRIEQAGVEYILDVAHNPQAAAVLAVSLAANPVSGKTSMLLGMLGDKDCIGVVSPILPLVQRCCIASLPGPRGARSQHLLGQIHAAGLEADCIAFDSLKQAYDFLSARTEAGDRVVVMGSFLTVAGILEVLHKN